MGMHPSAFKLLAKHKQHQIDEQLAMQGKYRTEGPGWYVTVQIEGPDGPEVYKVWAADYDEDAPHRGRRMNPPLPEHMAHDDLREIAHHLGPRLQYNLRESVDFVLHCLLSIEEAAVDNPHADAIAIMDSCTEAINALNFAMLSEAQRSNRKMMDEATRRSLRRRGPL